MAEKDILLKVENLKMYFPAEKTLGGKVTNWVKAVDDVSFEVERGKTFGLVGESGCGKTTTGKCILRINDPTEGHIYYNGMDLAAASRSDIWNIRREIQLIFQDPYGSLDPRQTAGSVVGEAIKTHKLAKDKADYDRRINELFEAVGLDPGLKDRAPHEFSGGQRQRLCIAAALASEPKFIICDEPISALDVSIQAQIINLLIDLQAKRGLTYLFIAHDLSVVRHISDRIAVMYLGRVVEISPWDKLYERPLHPYTKALLSAIPIPDPVVEKARERTRITGEVPSLMNRPTGCVFHPRCPYATEQCSKEVPPLVDYDGHKCACFKAAELNKL